MMFAKVLFKYFLFLSIALVHLFQQPDAKEIVKKTDEKFRGVKSSYGEITITIMRSTWSREMSIKRWTISDKYAMVLTTAPTKDKGTAFLKREKEIWNRIPHCGKNHKVSSINDVSIVYGDRFHK